MRNYRGAAPGAIQDPITRDAVYAIHSYLEQLNHIIGPKFNPSTGGLNGAVAAAKVGGWDTAETLIDSGKVAANPTKYTGDMIYRNASGRLDRLGVVQDGMVLKTVLGLPAWANQPNAGGKVFYPPTVFEGHAVTTVGTGPDFAQAISMSASTKTHITTTIVTPPAYDGTGHFVVYFAGGTTGDNIVINLYATDFTVGSTAIDQAGSLTDRLVCAADPDGFVMVSPDSVNCQTALGSYPTRIVVERDPTDADDTHPDPIYFVGLELHYSALL